eukprot:TRINITY_DN4462_c0_g1_i2.p1 TRINITY_DN4462_c0_g1~~TRINITY_DN4462_c0_g1_i2.p1  ORF type:complete len:239 (+),score=20.55 TRINITY_DN4462_c0_g1_i2:90-806(+)
MTVLCRSGSGGSTDSIMDTYAAARRQSRGSGDRGASVSGSRTGQPPQYAADHGVYPTDQFYMHHFRRQHAQAMGGLGQDVESPPESPERGEWGRLSSADVDAEIAASHSRSLLRARARRDDVRSASDTATEPPPYTPVLRGGSATGRASRRDTSLLGGYFCNNQGVRAKSSPSAVFGSAPGHGGQVRIGQLADSMRKSARPIPLGVVQAREKMRSNHTPGPGAYHPLYAVQARPSPFA